MDGRSRTTGQASSTGKTGKAVLDASALLAYLFDEPGAETVAEALASGVAMSAVNLSEVLAKLEDHGVGVDRAIRYLTAYGILDAIEIMDFTLAQGSSPGSGVKATSGRVWAVMLPPAGLLRSSSGLPPIGPSIANTPTC